MIDKNKIRCILNEIKESPELIDTIKKLLRGDKPTSNAMLALLIFDGQYRPTLMGTSTSIYDYINAEIPPHILEKETINYFWKKIFQQMEETNWDIKRLKI